MKLRELERQVKLSSRKRPNRKRRGEEVVTDPPGIGDDSIAGKPGRVVDKKVHGVVRCEEKRLFTVENIPMTGAQGVVGRGGELQHAISRSTGFYFRRDLTSALLPIM